MIKRALASLLFCLALSSAAAAQVERASFDTSPFALGALTEAEGALDRDLWRGADAALVEAALEQVPTYFEDVAKQMILRRVLLSPGEGPEGADQALAGLKLLRAAEAGYVMEAGALAASTPGLSVQPELSRIVAMRHLYRGEIDPACGRGANLREGRQAPFFVRLRAFCYIHAGERPAAELTLTLAREEGVLSSGDEQMFRMLLAERAPTVLPENALAYAAYRKRGGTFGPEDVAAVPPATAAAIALDRGIGVQTRLAALHRAAGENLLSERDLAEAAVQLEGTIIAEELAAIDLLSQGTGTRAASAGAALQGAAKDHSAFLLRTKIFSSLIANSAPDAATIPYAAEFALASLLNRRFADAERWMQAVAAEPSIGAERAFLNLAKLYSYMRMGPAQRLASAIGENLPEPPPVSFNIADPGAQASSTSDLASLTAIGLDAAASGSRAAQLLVALGTAGVLGEGELEVVRDTLGASLYERAGAGEFAREAAFRREALAFAGRLREDEVNQQAYIPRLKPETRRR